MITSLASSTIATKGNASVRRTQKGTSLHLLTFILNSKTRMTFFFLVSNTKVVSECPSCYWMVTMVVLDPHLLPLYEISLLNSMRERKSHRSKTTWGWVNDDRIFTCFGITVTLSSKQQQQKRFQIFPFLFLLLYFIFGTRAGPWAVKPLAPLGSRREEEQFTACCKPLN